MGGHSTSDDPNAYRGADDLSSWAKRDPIARLGDHLRKHGAWDDEREGAFRDRLAEEFRACVAKAEGTPPPPLESMFEDVYQSLPWHLEEQRDELLRGPRAPKSH
jgi:TPP-dependent pyruvate/acetoin dehydrogenase alpha subunit